MTSLRIDDPSLPVDLEPVFRLARAAYPNEACGVILHGPHGFRVVPLANAAPDPRHHFAFDDTQWLTLLREADTHGETVRCVFHSHTSGPAHFSSEDHKGATAAGKPRVSDASQLVIALDEDSLIEARVYRWNGAFFAESCRATAPI